MLFAREAAHLYNNSQQSRIVGYVFDAHE